MKNFIFCFVFIFYFLIYKTANCQKDGSKKIILKLTDTVNIYNRVKYSLVNSEFIVKDNGIKDSLTTYTQEFSGIFYKLTGIIKGDTVKLSGVYGLKRLDDFGYTDNPKKYQPIIYYKGSQAWRLLQHVASLIGGDISYDQ